jgi:hypothetical protein
MLFVLAWTWWAWKKQHCQQNTLSTAGSMHPAAVTAGATAALDPITSLLLTVIPTHANSGSSSNAVLGTWAVVLQAALYEGLLGVSSLRLLGGRCWLWLLLWEAWVAWIASNLLTSSSRLVTSRGPADRLCSSSSARKQLAQTGFGTSSKRGSWVERLPLPGAGARSAAATADNSSVAAASSGSGSGNATSGSAHGVLFALLNCTGLGALHLGLPVVLAAVGLWR